MSKEVTLEELAKTARKQLEDTAPQNVKKDNTNTVNTNIESGKAISVSDLGSHLRKTHNIEEKVSEESPMVKDAFDSMFNTLAERKRRISEEFMPIVEANARDMAMQRELGVDVFNTKLGDREEGIDSIPNENTISANINNDIISDTASTITDDLEKELNDAEDSTEESIVEPVIEKTYTVHNDEEKKPEKKEKKTVPQKDTNTVIEENSGEDDLDALMKDLEKEESKLDIEDDNEDTAEEIRARFKESLESVKIARDPIDLSKFKIRKTAVSSATVLSNVSARPQTLKRADWALFYTGRSMTFVESRGPELDALRKTISNSNGVNAVIASLKFIYDHTADANKPTFEAWCKLIRTEDIESLYFGLYRACYADANLVARACIGDKGCKRTSLIDTDINAMVKFEDDETKEKFYSILNKDSTTESFKVESELIQISDDFVLSYTMPTLFSTFIQYATLKPEVTEKYSDILNTMAYIDGFFSIDRQSQELVPISVKEFPNNINRTVLSKLKLYTDILKTLSVDQYNILNAKLNNIIQTSKVTYVYPEATCPECGTTIEEENIESVLNLLFTRAQLVQIKSL